MALFFILAVAGVGGLAVWKRGQIAERHRREDAEAASAAAARTAAEVKRDAITLWRPPSDAPMLAPSPPPGAAGRAAAPAAVSESPSIAAPSAPVAWAPTPRPSTLPRSMTAAWREGAAGFRSASEARAGARAPMLLYFHTDWCPWCKKLDQTVLATDTVADGLAGLLKVRINPEDSDEDQALARRFGVTGYPTVLVLGSGSESASRIPSSLKRGTLSPDSFVAAVERAAQ